eukprot:SAG22_NODE_1055_length_5789_cov_3.943234_3_plen_271_part_00
MLKRTDMLRCTQSLVTYSSEASPETMRKLIFINAPSFFHVAHALFAPLMSERTLDKVQVFGADYMEPLIAITGVEPVQRMVEESNRVAAELLARPGASAAEYQGEAPLDAALPTAPPEPHLRHMHDAPTTIVPRSSAAVAKGCVAAGAAISWSLLVQKDDIAFKLVLYTEDGPVVAAESRHGVSTRDAGKLVSGEFTAAAAGVLVATLTNEMWMHEAHVVLAVDFQPVCFETGSSADGSSSCCWSKHRGPDEAAAPEPAPAADGPVPTVL